MFASTFACRYKFVQVPKTQPGSHSLPESFAKICLKTRPPPKKTQQKQLIQSTFAKANIKKHLQLAQAGLPLLKAREKTGGSRTVSEELKRPNTSAETNMCFWTQNITLSFPLKK